MRILFITLLVKLLILGELIRLISLGLDPTPVKSGLNQLAGLAARFAGPIAGAFSINKIVSGYMKDVGEVAIDCSLPGSSVHGILQARILARVGCHFLLQGELLLESNFRGVTAGTVTQGSYC